MSFHSTAAPPSAGTGLRLGRNTRACMVCSVIKTQSDFIRDGCPNCEDIVGYQNNAEAVQDCTSANFNGVIALTDPEKSWVAKWQRLDKYVPGLYAVQVVGVVPPEVISELASRGIKYVPRDGTKEEDLREEEEGYEDEGGEEDADEGDGRPCMDNPNEYWEVVSDEDDPEMRNTGEPSEEGNPEM